MTYVKCDGFMWDCCEWKAAVEDEVVCLIHTRLKLVV